MARFLILFGVFLVIAGLFVHLKVQVHWLTSWVGKLPGDLTIKKGNLTIYFPLMTSLFISVLLSILLSVFFRSSR